jgi:hypothetical protein
MFAGTAALAELAALAADELDELSSDAMEEVLVDIWRLVNVYVPCGR